MAEDIETTVILSAETVVAMIKVLKAVESYTMPVKALGPVRELLIHAEGHRDES